MKYGSSTNSWKPWRWVRFDLILTMKGIYFNSNLNILKKVTSSNRINKFKDIFPCNTSELITKTFPISTRTVISYVIKWVIQLWLWWKVNENWDNNMIRITQWRESHCRTNTTFTRKKEIQKLQDCANRSLGSGRKVNYLIKVVWDRKIITEFNISISSTRIGYPFFMMDVTVSKEMGWSENPIYVRWNRIKNRA